MADADSVTVFKLRDGQISLPSDLTPLLQASQFLAPNSEEFEDWLIREGHYIDLTAFNQSSMQLTLDIIYKRSLLTLADSIDYVDFISLCSYLLVEEDLLLKVFRPDCIANLYDKRKHVLAFCFKCKVSGYAKLGMTLMHHMRFPGEFLEQATSFKILIKRVKYAKRFNEFYRTHLQRKCLCRKCADWRSERSLQLFADSEPIYPNPYFGPPTSVFFK